MTAPSAPSDAEGDRCFPSPNAFGEGGVRAKNIPLQIKLICAKIITCFGNQNPTTYILPCDHGRRSSNVQVCLFLRREIGRRKRQRQESFGRQGRQPGRDVPSGDPGAGRIHHLHRDVHRILQEQQEISAGAEKAGGDRPGQGGEGDGHEVRRQAEPPAGLGAFRSTQFHARNDGDGAERRPVLGHQRRPTTPASSTTPTAA